MTEFPSGVTVVTAYDRDGVPYGLTLSAFCAFTAEPPSVLASIDQRSNTLPAIHETGLFAVNFLDAEHSELARRFASKAPDKFDGLPVQRGPDGSGPILHDHACAYLTCRVAQAIAVDDHVIFIGRVQHGAVIDGRHPLVYGRREFGAWQRAVQLAGEAA